MADGRLKKIDVAGGPPQTIAEAASANGGTWSPEGVILFNASGGGLSRVSANGGAVTPVTTLDQGEIRHVNPRFLPDGQHVLYASVGIASNIYVGPWIRRNAGNSYAMSISGSRTPKVVYSSPEPAC